MIDSLVWPKLRFVARGLNRLYHRRGYLRSYNTDGVDVLEEDWDNLLILDACRYDLFAEENTIDGRLESRESRGSATVEFLRANFADEELLDTVYVTANPRLHQQRDSIDTTFYAVDDVWLGDGWDEDADTVRPEVLADRALEAAERYDDKRLIVHFMQPHYPFLGSDIHAPMREREEEEPFFWHGLMRGTREHPPEDIWEAYRENLHRALPAVSDLVASLDGKSVVTADHGNMIAERSFPVPLREWGHPPGIYTPQLVRVPWLIVAGERRRRIARAAEPAAEPSGEEPAEVVGERLEQLGYRE